MSLSSEEQERIYQEEKAREEARKRLKKEENRRKNKKIFIGLGIFFVLAMLMGILSSGKRTGTVAIDSSSPNLNKSQIELIDQLQREGYLRVEHKFNKAFIARSFWNQMDAKTKENFSAGLAVYCGTQKGTNLNWVEIFDMQGAKKLAKYGSWGFQVY
jgi:hypothetical protein